MLEQIAQHIPQITQRVKTIRHDIHRYPEIRYQESRTAQVVEAFLGECGIPFRRCAGTGIIAVIGNGKGRVVALRSELDALPMPDDSGLPYASVNEEAAHACGHDGHIAILLAVAWVLKQMEEKIQGAVKFIWQPAEEGGAGADRMMGRCAR